MNVSVFRRATALGAVTAALAFGLGSGAATASTPGSSAASAASAKPVLSLWSPDEVALPAKGTAATNWAWYADAKHVDAPDFTVTIDARGLAKVAKVVFSQDCTAQGLVATCTDPIQGDSATLPHPVWISAQLQLSVLPGAKLGATGSYKVTGHSASLTVVGGTGRVTVGGADYTTSRLPSNLGKLPLKSAVPVPITFTNTGNRPANGSRVLFFASAGLSFAPHYSNCRYGRYGHGTGPTSTVALCTFPGQIRVGEQVTLAQPVRLRFTSRALYEQVQGIAGPAGDTQSWGWVTSAASGIVWTQGKGAVLGLKVLKAGHATSAPAATSQLADTYDHDFWTFATAKNTADFGTTGFSAKATKGSKVTVKLTLTNHGPADLNDYSGGGEATPGLMVTPPPGTTVVGSSSGCAPFDSSKPRGPYFCQGSAFGQASGTTQTFTLTLRVDKVIAGATGSVRVRYWPNVPPGQQPYSVWYDPNARNDSASIRLN